jgi:hypothetical protein
MIKSIAHGGIIGGLTLPIVHEIYNPDAEIDSEEIVNHAKKGAVIGGVAGGVSGLVTGKGLSSLRNRLFKSKESTKLPLKKD